MKFNIDAFKRFNSYVNTPEKVSVYFLVGLHDSWKKTIIFLFCNIHHSIRKIYTYIVYFFPTFESDSIYIMNCMLKMNKFLAKKYQSVSAGGSSVACTGQMVMSPFQSI